MKIIAVELQHSAEDETGSITHVILNVGLADGTWRQLEVTLPWFITDRTGEAWSSEDIAAANRIFDRDTRFRVGSGDPDVDVGPHSSDPEGA